MIMLWEHPPIILLGTLYLSPSIPLGSLHTAMAQYQLDRVWLRHVRQLLSVNGNHILHHQHKRPPSAVLKKLS